MYLLLQLCDVFEHLIPHCNLCTFCIACVFTHLVCKDPPHADAFLPFRVSSLLFELLLCRKKRTFYTSRGVLQGEIGFFWEGREKQTWTIKSCFLSARSSSLFCLYISSSRSYFCKRGGVCCVHIYLKNCWNSVVVSANSTGAPDAPHFAYLLRTLCTQKNIQECPILRTCCGLVAYLVRSCCVLGIFYFWSTIHCFFFENPVVFCGTTDSFHCTK